MIINSKIIFQGNDHIIFNGSFFYLNKEMEKIIRFPLPRGEPKSIDIPKNRVVLNSGKYSIILDILCGYIKILIVTDFSKKIIL